jgi:hypothetical protein
VVNTARDSSAEVENAVFQWEEGYRSLRETRSEPQVERALARTVVAIQDELRKRLGSTFRIAELAALYREGSDWTLDLALRTRPENLARWDPSVAVDGAFYLYMREAADFAGGRRRH